MFLLGSGSFDRPAIRSSSSPVAWLDGKRSRGGSLLVLFADDEWGGEEGKSIIRFGTLKGILNALEICYCVFRKCDSMSSIASSPVLILYVIIRYPIPSFRNE